MLVESIVRQTLDLKDHRVVAVEQDRRQLTATLELRRGRRLVCSGCGERRRVRDRLPRRRFRHVPMWGLSVVLHYAPARVKCRTCGTKVERIPWARGKSPLSRGLVGVLATWTRLLAWDVVAKLFHLSWGTVRAAVQEAVTYGLKHRRTGSVLYIGIDEISRRRGHVYHTQVYDLQGKRLLWSGEGRETATLQRFFDDWGPERTARIEAICCDMWNPYVDVVRERACQAVLVFDKFHLIRHLLAAVNTVRKSEARELSKTHPELLRGSRYLWLKNPWNLSDKQRQRLGCLEHINLRINRAYLLKEAFRTVWAYTNPVRAKRFLNKWFWWATHSRLKPLRDFAWMLRRHEQGVLAWFKVAIDNGSTEAMNNNAKAISHRAHGYRTAGTFTLSLLHCLGKMPLPTTAHKFL